MKIQYRNINFRQETLDLIALADSIVGEYEAQGLHLTLRQVYYQFVARGHLANTERNYKRLGDVIADARMAGLLSWETIEDRTRFVRDLAHWSNPADIVNSAVSQFRNDKWGKQPERVEVWIEKDALIGVIEGVCRELDVPFFSCRGYISSSELWRASVRIINRREEDNQKTVILHLGDHDPSGLDMTRDIEDRLVEFGAFPVVERIALTRDQIDQFNPPPNPAKQTDARFAKYVDEHGFESWELDALDPKFLRDLVLEKVFEHRDARLWAKAVREEKQQIERLKKVAKELVKEFEK